MNAKTSKIAPKAKTPGKARTAKKRKTFKLAAPQASSVYLAGSFNDWDTSARPLKIDAKGVWKTILTLTPGQYEYRYIVDGQWQNDPTCDNLQENLYGTTNCTVEI